MTTPDHYAEFTSRNAGYIEEKTQKKIHDIHVLIAGCGIGSQVAVALARMGVTRFTLIDGDHVSLTNLNRQAYYADQVGKNKSAALAQNLQRINPLIKSYVCEFHFDHTTFAYVERADLVIDTIDFLDLKAILQLHEAAEEFRKPLISGMSVGWGSCAIYFSNKTSARQQFRKIFGVDPEEQKSLSYVVKFAQLFKRIQAQIDPQVVQVMQETFQKLANNQPCPAPQVVGGSCNLASLMSSVFFRHVNGDKIPESPYLIISDTNKILEHSLYNLG